LKAQVAASELSRFPSRKDAEVPTVKICGIMALEDARAAVHYGADYLGFVFVPGRRRRMTIEQVRTILNALGSAAPPAVGLFVDEDPATVTSVASACGLSYVQLCGQESPEYCTALGLPVWKTIGLRSTEDYRRMAAYHVVRFVLEGAANGPGGTGQPWEWDLARQAPRTTPFLLAGGLTPQNVAEAIAKAQPWGVDVSSGVETNGKKDPEKIAAFIRQAKQTRIAIPQ